jgi:hypothetical protein
MAGFFFAVSSQEIIITGKKNREDTKKMIEEINKKYMPDSVVIFIPSDEKEPEITKIADFTKEFKEIDGKATVYICSNYSCNLKTVNIDEIL